MSSKFVELLKSQINQSLPTINDVYHDKLNKTIEFNNTAVGLYVFEPTPAGFKESYDKFMSLKYDLKRLSNSSCYDIWGVITNDELYNIWVEHLNDIKDSKYVEDEDLDRIKAASDKLLNDDTFVTINKPLLTPNEILNKGAFNINGKDNYYGVIATHNESFDLNNWKRILLSDNCNNIYQVPNYTKCLNEYYTKIHHTNLSKKEKDGYRQAMLELGWLPNCKPDVNNTIISNLRNRPNVVIDLRNIKLDGNKNIILGEWLFLVCVYNKELNYYTPYISIDLNEAISLDFKDSFNILDMSRESMISIYAMKIDNGNNLVKYLHNLNRNNLDKFYTDNFCFYDNDEVIHTPRKSIESLIKNLFKTEDIDLVTLAMRLSVSRLYLVFEDKVANLENKKITSKLALLNPDNTSNKELLESCIHDFIDNPTKMNLLRLTPLIESISNESEKETLQNISESVFGMDNMNDSLIQTINEEANNFQNLRKSIINETVIHKDDNLKSIEGIIDNIIESMNKDNLSGIKMAFDFNNTLEKMIYRKNTSKQFKNSLHLERARLLESLESALDRNIIDEIDLKMVLLDENEFNKNIFVRYSTNNI